MIVPRRPDLGVGGAIPLQGDRSIERILEGVVITQIELHRPESTTGIDLTLLIVTQLGGM